jgi:two-component system chemotaxis response regulator CheY
VRVLIIDDSRAMRAVIARLMRQMGFEVSEACHGREALDMLTTGERIDIALVDWNMPEMDGIEFVRAVRAEPRYKGLLLMMVTTETESVNVVRALTAGADEYLMKPFDRTTIEQKLEVLGVRPAADA